MQKLLLFLLIIFNSGYSQTLKVLDGETKEPIPFATILLMQDGKTVSGSYCDGNGAVTLADGQNFDAVSFSCIGYGDKTIAKSSLADTIYLNKSAYELKEVAITGKAGKSHKMGFLHAKRKIYVVGSLGGEVVLFVPNSFHEPKPVKSFQFTTRQVDAKEYRDIRIAFRLRFYTVDKSTGKPGKELPVGNIIQYIDKKSKKHITVNLQGYGLILPEGGLFAGIEWLDCVDMKGNKVPVGNHEWYFAQVEYNENNNNCYTFTRNRLKDMEWKNLRDCVNASFGIEVSE